MSTPSKGSALVTGAAQGIGQAIALRLAQDGFDVAVNDIPSNRHNLDKVVEDIKALGRRSVPVIADVSIEDEVKEMIGKVVQELGSLDVMIANAGICQSSISVLDTTVDQWEIMFNINVKGTFLCYKYAGIQMVTQGKGGRIVGACSIASKRGTAGLGAYAASKFAIRGLTQSTAAELGKHGITVNAYAPGAVYTQLMDQMASAWSDANEQSKQTFVDQLSSRTAVGYNGSPADVASAVSYLVSKEAHFITGQSVSINGGAWVD